MSRILTTATLLALGLALGACQQQGGKSTGGSRAAPDLAGAFARSYGARVAESFPAAQRDGVARCIGQALAYGVPLEDQFLIYDQLKSGKKTPQSQAAMARWLGGPVVHGPVKTSFKNNNTGGFKNNNNANPAPAPRLSFADGTAVPAADVVAARIDGHIQQFCAPYKDRLMKAGYVSGVAGGGGPGGGFSTGD